MINLIKKDILVLVRNKTELFLLLLMPIILIAILGFALRGVLGGDTSELKMDVVLVQHDNEEVGIEEFVQDLNEIGLPEEVVSELQVVAEEISPYQLLKNGVLTNEALQEMIVVSELNATEAEQALSDGDAVAILTIPEDFTYHMLQKVLLDQGEGSNFDITINEHGSILAGVFQDIIDSFARQWNLETAVVASLGDEWLGSARGEQQELGGIETLTANEPVNSFQYYTIGMAVMFVLFVAASISSRAYLEKQQHVFNRILLSGTAPVSYLGGKMISAIMIAFLQLFILFSASTLIFQAFKIGSLHFWLGMMGISMVLALCVGGIAALLTSVSIRFNNNTVSHIFSGGLVSLFAFAGGSFFPVDDLPAFISVMGNWTPNGAALTAYVQWTQGMELANIIAPLTRITVLAVLVLIVSILIYPKRRSV